MVDSLICLYCINEAIVLPIEYERIALLGKWAQQEVLS